MSLFKATVRRMPYRNESYFYIYPPGSSVLEIELALTDEEISCLRDGAALVFPLLGGIKIQPAEYVGLSVFRQAIRTVALCAEPTKSD